MSSHYIIRDDQEPALLIRDSSRMKEDLIFSLLEWNPLVIIYETEIGFVMHHGINIDAIVLDKMAETEVEEYLGIQRPYDVLYAVDFPEQLIEYLSVKGMSGVDVVGAFDKSTRHFVEEVARVFPANIFSNNTKFIPCTRHFQKWAPAGRGFTVFPEDAPVVTSNLRQFTPDSYKVEREGTIRIAVMEPVWIGEILQS